MDTSDDESGQSWSDTAHDVTVRTIRGIFGQEASVAVDKALPILGDLVLLRWLSF
jgi:hypothetical protein